MPNGLSESLHNWMHIVMRANMKKLNLFAKQKGYSLSQLNTLFRVHYRGSISISELSAESGVSPAATSQLIDKLVAQDLVRRIEDDEDRRNKNIDLTPSGNAVVEASKKERSGWLDELSNSFTHDEQELIQKAIELLIKNTLEIEKREEIL